MSEEIEFYAPAPSAQTPTAAHTRHDAVTRLLRRIRRMAWELTGLLKHLEEELERDVDDGR